MPNRTVKLIGRAYSNSGSASLTVSLNGTQVYSGTVPTVNTAVPTDRSSPAVELCTFALDGATAGDLPLSVSVSNGTAFFGQLWMNYNAPRVSWSDEKDADGFAIPTPLEDPATTFRDSNNTDELADSKLDIKVDGVAPDEVRDSDPSLGQWEYRINNGQTLTCKYKTVAAQFPA